MGTVIRIDGEPLVRFTFDYIPSWNEHLTAEVHAALRRKGPGHRWHTATWRMKGRDIALQFMAECGPKDRLFLINPIPDESDTRAFLWVKVYRETEHIYDVHNVYLKALLDGFTEASIWPDDDWAYVPYVLCSWVYGGPQRFEVEVHQLDMAFHNGVAQVLPSGRRKKG
jgi:hypothetical protein